MVRDNAITDRVLESENGYYSNGFPLLVQVPLRENESVFQRLVKRDEPCSRVIVVVHSRMGWSEGRVVHAGIVVRAVRHARATEPELKGSIGEGPNHSNHSNHSNSFKIGIFRNFSLENSKISENFNIF